jgi:stage V sporulation protein B
LAGSHDIARQTVRGSFIVLVGDIIWAALIAILLLVVARLLGPTNYGEYTIALVIPNALQLLIGVGLNVSINRFAAFHISRNEPEIALRKTRNGSLCIILVAGLIAAVNFVAAGYLSANILRRPEVTYLVQLGSLFVLGQALLQSSIASLVGWGYNMHASVAQVLESVFELSLSPALILLGFAVTGGVLGHVLSYLFAGLISFVVTLSILSTKFQGGVNGLRYFVNDVREMTSYAFSQFIGKFLYSFSQQYYPVIVLSVTVSNAFVAYYQAAFNITSALILISTSLSLTLLPAFTRLFVHSKDIGLGLRYGVKYISLFATPFVFFVIGSSRQIIQVLYGTQYLQASSLLSLLGLSSLPVTMGMSVLPPFFNAIGRTRLTSLTYIANAASLFILAPVLAVYTTSGAMGVAEALIISNFVGLLIGAVVTQERVRVRFGYRDNLLILGVCTVGIIPLIAISPMVPGLIGLAVDLILFFGIYLVLIPLLKVVDQDDLRRIGEWTVGLWPLNGVLRPILEFESKLVR